MSLHRQPIIRNAEVVLQAIELEMGELIYAISPLSIEYLPVRKLHKTCYELMASGDDMSLNISLNGEILSNKTNSVALSPQANYTD
jgi:hypothetical protein